VRARVHGKGGAAVERSAARAVSHESTCSATADADLLSPSLTGRCACDMVCARVCMPAFLRVDSGCADSDGACTHGACTARRTNSSRPLELWKSRGAHAARGGGRTPHGVGRARRTGWGAHCAIRRIRSIIDGCTPRTRLQLYSCEQPGQRVQLYLLPLCLSSSSIV